MRFDPTFGAFCRQYFPFVSPSYLICIPDYIRPRTANGYLPFIDMAGSLRLFWFSDRDTVSYRETQTTDTTC